MPVALVTRASEPSGRAVAEELAARDWLLVLDGDDETALAETAGWLAPATVLTVAGDLADPRHRARVLAAVAEYGCLDVAVGTGGPAFRELAASLAAAHPDACVVRGVSAAAVLRAVAACAAA